VTRSASDVLIVGGGPAGLYAGLQLARAGHGVDLVEEHREFGSPVHCTGVLARDAFDVFDLPAGSLLNELRQVRFVAPSGAAVDYTTPTTEAVVIDRVRFDRQLADEAQRAGVRFHQGRVTDVSVDRAGVRATTAETTFRARATLLACGASYGLQRKLGLGLPKLLLQSAQAEIPADRPGDVEVHFGAAAAPRGFAWAVPVHRSDRPYVRIGVMCQSRAADHFHAMVERLRTRWGVAAPEGLTPRQKVLPLAPIDRTYAERVLVLGDAAGLVKPTTGGGIYYGLLSARLAAETWNAIKAEPWSLAVSDRIPWARRLWPATDYHHMLGGSGAQGVGYAAPAALGVGLANKAKGLFTVTFQPDGDLMYSPGILWTAAYHKIPVLFVMHNNRAYHQEIMHLQRMAAIHGRRPDQAWIGNVIDNPAIDYAKLAQAQGVWAEGPIEDPAKLGAALQRAVAVVKKGGPALVDVVCQGR